jgi:hypothetical protein
MKPGLLLSLFIAVPLSAQTITLTPSTPKAGDSVVVTVRSCCGSSCPASTLSTKLVDQTIQIERVAVTPCQACPPESGPVTFTTEPVTLPAANDYTIEYAVTDCNGIRHPQFTKQVLVRPQCAFDRSLTVDPAGASTGSGTFKWCDPSYFPGADIGQLATAYRVFLTRQNEAPILVAEQDASKTSAFVELTAAEASATGAFVEADLCDETIAGCRGFSTMRSNIVPINVANGCNFGGGALCLAGRFSVTAHFRTETGSGLATPLNLTKDSGYFWFFGPDNAEVVVKMVDACSTAVPRFWFFAAGLTDVGVDIEVLDTKNGIVRRYSSPRGTAFAPVQDTNAFACQ